MWCRCAREFHVPTPDSLVLTAACSNFMLASRRVGKAHVLKDEDVIQIVKKI